MNMVPKRYPKSIYSKDLAAGYKIYINRKDLTARNASHIYSYDLGRNLCKSISVARNVADEEKPDTSFLLLPFCF